jgi:uncharacterized membrane protein YdjX (TVP38/TMEM64 family)
MKFKDYIKMLALGVCPCIVPLLIILKLIDIYFPNNLFTIIFIIIFGVIYIYGIIKYIEFITNKIDFKM